MNSVDNSTSSSGYSSSNSASGQGGGFSGGQYEQIQSLQRELQSLRGQIEQLNYQVKQLQQDQKDQYLDLDGRISRLSSTSASSDMGAGTGAADLPASSSEGASGPSDAASGSGNAGGTTASSSASEQAEYDSAFQLVRSRAFDQAATAYQQFVQRYPSGKLTGNAWYWLGEIYLAMSPPDTAQSREAFAKVVTAFPENRKVPDALYKLGVLSARRGDKDNAKNYLQQVISGYADSSAAKLAQDYLKTLN
ncbi:tol-pal system protein YbgF [Pokkaliibacter sp. CJK22405]|uniref:tol-pal system protein YbgF n=1 Tax=Pokkaliibacter sp. CJK22405 TaxID=3384615 RepID=UPI003984AD53